MSDDLLGLKLAQLLLLKNTAERYLFLIYAEMILIYLIPNLLLLLCFVKT